MNSMQLIPSMAVEHLPDSDRYKVRFKVRSETSNQLYMISYDSAPGAQYWVCNCRGYMRHGQCKHLTACGLKGRKFGKTKLEYTSSNSTSSVKELTYA